MYRKFPFRMAAILLAASAVWPAAAQAQSLRFMTAASGGAFFTLGSALAEIIEREVPGTSVTVQPGGSQANIKAISLGKADLGLTGSAAFGTALQGKPPFNEPVKNVLQLGTFWTQAWQLGVIADADIENITDLAGKYIAVSTRGSVGESTTRQVLGVYGLEYSDLGSAEYIAGTAAVDGMKNGRLDGFSPVGPVPYGFFLDISTSENIRMIGIDDDKAAELQKLNPGYVRTKISAGIYKGVDKDVPTVGDTAMLVGSADLDPALVEKIMRAVAKPENIERLRTVMSSLKGLTAEYLQDSHGMPRHPGAEAAAK